jgi:hypothetical protein
MRKAYEPVLKFSFLLTFFEIIAEKHKTPDHQGFIFYGAAEGT